MGRSVTARPGRGRGQDCTGAHWRMGLRALPPAVREVQGMQTIPRSSTLLARQRILPEGVRVLRRSPQETQCERRSVFQVCMAVTP